VDIGDEHLGNPSAPPGKAHKYARIERERRWLMREPPSPNDATAEVEITDIYFDGTRLRLRRMVDRRDNAPTVYKLTQKVPGSSTVGLITNTYLSDAEYALLSQLNGHPLRKVRFSIPPFGVDVFLPPLEGLVLAEMEFESGDAMAAATAPEGAVREVTGDIGYTGGHLAQHGLDSG
jgi:CYTH domain-containing protein